ncbi:MAG: UDP-N-acetylmuramate--L-alanine ligase [Candidatus Eisenbacteria bacterium]|nr:UDP-N-acetylmuramate--L-alanine ligase [Candidatus Eisenbacteria bacterium]
MYARIKRIHFIGIGGTGMCGIAEVLINMGYSVSGSDLRDSEVTNRLSLLGANIFLGHTKQNVAGAHVVVVSSAIGSDNPELLGARELKIPSIPRAEMLAELMRMKYGVAVAGAHGKTTTTSLVAEVLAKGGLDPTIVVGGRLRAIGTNARLGTGEFLVAEADESDGSFLKLSPTIAVVTNIDAEHLDHYSGIDEIKDTFVQFVNRVPFYGAVVACLDDANVQSILPRIEKRVLTYGIRTGADLLAKELRLNGERCGFQVWMADKLLGEVDLKLPGLHNILNSLAAVSVGLELGVDFERVKEALGEFQGVSRRLEVRGRQKGILVIDDYGHHPTEIAAVLDTIRRTMNKRIVVAFQPHRYTRTKALRESFGVCFSQADFVFVTPIYAAGEEPIPGVSSELIVNSVKKTGQKGIELVASLEELTKSLLKFLEDGDVLVTLGAGDIWKTGDEVLKGLA